ncbi:phage portal protein [Enterococcus faecium]|uniref:phage portal protein n=1 Tax=Enterococcus faecium TaxID=1352 RepID=UPI0035CBEF4A
MVGEEMGVLQRIKNFFKKGVKRASMQINGRELGKITDHPKIGIDPKEYERIAEDFRYYAADFPQVKYIDSYGKRMNRQFNSLNVAKTASRRLASIIFNEKCKVTLKVPDAKTENTINLDEANAFLEKTLYANNFYNLFELNLEKGVAAGGFAMRPYVDNDEIKISWIRADQFYPLRSNTNEVSECAIATRSIQSEGNINYYYTLLEFHEWVNGNYVITNELYKSELESSVGKQVPLETIYPDLAETVTLEGLKRPLFVYFRTPGANNKSLESPLGLGIVDNAREVLDTINSTHDQFTWEIDMGQRRVVVPAEFLKTDEAHPPMFDSGQNVFVGMYGAERVGVQDITTAIRTVQYKDAISYFIKEFEVQVGLSVGSMNYADDGLKTATEIVSNNSMTYQTRSSYLTMVEKAINELIHSIFELAGYKEFFSMQKPLIELEYESYVVNVSFEDGVFVNQDKQQEDDLKAVVAGVMPKKQFLIRNYNLTEEELEEWLSDLTNEMPSQEAGTNDRRNQDAMFDVGD